jgi:tetratricopeptide (TPR) repeat protein
MADDASSKPETALTRPMIATDLDRAGKGQLVYVGRDGEVKNPSTVRSRQIAQYIAFGGITTAGVALAATSFPLLVPFYLALGGRFLGTVRAVKHVNEASVALSRGDSATGRELAERVARAWWAPTRVRALAELRIAIADALDGHGDQALERVRRARGKLSPRLIQHQFSYYTEINLLTSLGRTKEARNLLESRGPIPTGEVLKLSHWIAQMHLWVAEAAPKPVTDAMPFKDPEPAKRELEPGMERSRFTRDLEIDEGELHDRMRKGLSMTAGADLLLLCAWCYAYRGEHDDAIFVYKQAKDREGSHRLDVAMPAVAKWVEEYRKDHPEVDQPDADE